MLGLPPAFVLSQDQTLRLKDLILVWLRGSHSKDYCVTGTFTLNARHNRLPGHNMRLVMAYETQIYQSLVDEPILFPELTHLQGPRRLRFLFFRIRMSKSKEQETYHRGCGGDRNNAVQPELPGVNFGFDQKVLPLKGAEAVSAPDKDRINRKPLLVSTSFLKNLRPRPIIDHNYLKYMCKNLHRTVGAM